MPVRLSLCFALLSATSAMPQSCTNNSGACLATLTNAASFEAGSVAPGELVTLFGTGLGPRQGVQPQATLQSPFPTQAANVEVTFDGTPAPLLLVQDAQINAVAPWSLTPGQTAQVCVSYKETRELPDRAGGADSSSSVLGGWHLRFGSESGRKH